ncbi:MAG: efflux RND transporter periplasmic adaptor subunit [Flavobacteriaceae bacterium]|nr:efflux RND transporter periplasmic adaptor subunit [Flavobacteriaceae bacterium]
MRRLYIPVLALTLLVSCSENKNSTVDDVIASQNLEQIRKKKSELDAEQALIAANLKLLEDEIKKLDPQQKIPLITTLMANEQVFTHYLELQGNVSTKKNLVIYPEYSGVLTHVYVTEGKEVYKGQILAKIDDGGLSQQLSQLEIQADLARTTFERQKRLWEQNIGSEIQYLQAKSNYEAQTKAVNQMKEQIGKTTVRAPFSGTIDDVITEQGSVVMPGQSMLFRIVNLDDMYIETDVPERFVLDVKKGKDVMVEFPVLDRKINTKVKQAGNFINPANRTFKVEIGIPNSDGLIKPNLTAKLKINDYTNEKAILIPMSIISEDAEGNQYVYTIVEKAGNKGIAKRSIITTGKTQGDFIEVLSGIEGGQEIIDEGARSVREDQEVKILDSLYN